jgi:hypothetical protein
MTPEEMHTEALRLAEEAFDCDFDLERYSEPTKSERIANAIAAYTKALYGTVLPPQMAVVMARRLTPEEIAEFEQSWVARAPQREGCKIVMLDERQSIP